MKIMVFEWRKYDFFHFKFVLNTVVILFFKPSIQIIIYIEVGLKGYQ